jgi:hypothetical protein
MKKILFPGLTAGALLLVLSYALLYFIIQFFPQLVEEYYNPIFWPGDDRATLFFVHPFILAIALSWFWHRSKNQFSGAWYLRGMEMGLVYGVVATFPSLWITFSTISVTIAMVLSWLCYGFFQAIISGLVFARMNP